VGFGSLTICLGRRMCLVARVYLHVMVGSTVATVLRTRFYVGFIEYTRSQTHTHKTMEPTNALLKKLTDATNALNAWRTRYEFAMQASKAPNAASRLMQQATELKSKAEPFIPPVLTHGITAVEKAVPGIVTGSANAFISEANAAADEALKKIVELFGSLEAVPEAFKKDLPIKLELLKEAA
jgi:hypothetical protein